MSIVRDAGLTLVALEDTIFATCSALISTAATTGAVGMLSNKTTADAVAAAAETTAFGRVIDRLAAPLGNRYLVGMPAARLYSSRGSTEANRQLTLGVKLQHGDSSGGGDMADYSTAQQPATRNYFSTARTSDMKNWDGSLSTGALAAASYPAYYDLRAAKRYLRVGVVVGKNRVTTESSGDEQARVGASITFLGGDGQVPETANVVTSPYSTSTST